MPNRSQFDDIAEIGKEFLGLSRSDEALKNYTWVLGSIYDLLGHTHSIIIRYLDDIEAAASLAEAREIVAKLEDGPLTSSFRANGLCDLFEGFSHSLRRVVTNRDGSLNTLPVSDEHKIAWLQFCDTLQEREAQVALSYAQQIQELGNLIFTRDAAQSLNDLKAAAHQARNVLTLQIADFDSLTTQFRQALAERV